ncbi:MAG TPA: IPT/TIG domain-containing protein, partial [Candidatus Acidoferrum sp.]|nr:IPT/TIG domain-containing protein [Candidatus Acidoferrum sp.]
MLIGSRRPHLSTLQFLLGHLLRLCLLLLSLGLVQARAAISFVQSNSATPQTPQASVAVVYTLAQTAGNLNVVVVGWNDSTATISSVVDSKGNQYLVAAAPVVQTGTATQAIYYAKNIASAAAGTNTVTVTFSVAAVFADIRIAEYSGLDPNNPLDVSVGAQGTTTATSNSGSATTTNANDLLVGANLVQSTSTSAGTGFTSRGVTPDGDILEDRVVTVTGSYSATANLDKIQSWVMQMVAFRAASGTGGGPSITNLNPTSGPVATAVTISGTNFGSTQGTNTVTFNGTPA